jgi:electron transfer flavoprotein beta subunit
VFAGSDTLATSFALSSAIARIAETEPVDMVFCGKQTIDGDTAQVGPGIAKRLELNQLTYVEKIRAVDLMTRKITVERRAEGGVQVLSTGLPCLVTMLEGTNTVRRGTMADMLRAARSEIPMWSAAAAGIAEVGLCGLKGSPTVVKKVFAPQPRKEKAKLIEVPGGAPDDLAAATLTALFAADARLEETLFRQTGA